MPDLADTALHAPVFHMVWQSDLNIAVIQIICIHDTVSCKIASL